MSNLPVGYFEPEDEPPCANCEELQSTIDQLQAKVAELRKEANDYMHAISVLFTVQPKGDVLAERKPSKDVASYNAFIYLSTQGKILREALASTDSTWLEEHDREVEVKVLQLVLRLESPDENDYMVILSSDVRRMLDSKRKGEE